MRRLLGAFLLWSGVVVGVLVGVGLLVGARVNGVPWYVALGFVKAMLAAAAGLMASGAVLQRLAKRDEERKRMASRAGL